MTTPITTHTFESQYTPYRVDLYSDRAEVFVIKRNRHTGHSHAQAIKRGSQTFKRVLRDLTIQAQPGSLLREQMNECADTSPVMRDTLRNRGLRV